MRITVIGAHGKIALQALPQLVNAGHTVTGVIRNPDHADEIAATGAMPKVADIETLDGNGFTDLLADAELVIFSAGAGGGNPKRTKAVDHDAAIATMNHAPEGTGYIMVSYWGASTDHGVPEDHDFFPYAEAKGKADQHLRDSGHNYVIVMPGMLNDNPVGTVYLGSGSGEADVERTTSRATVAATLAGVVERFDALANRDLGVLDGDEDLATALDNAAN
ncbi:NAD(P)H-binding protein [Corynebacterium sp. TAE3-ERU12]|uniref:NAD(P)H-binding protein n=1 Tax=Corynebacterium sp. TAE3-ERU12 TaxID=2849491 RepID=UPI001C43E1DA|nr:NAD(P)H-binding protein [Corynebacterium sp. TAE3-ERU12]MBV7294846.1 NAD(P)H-binding protein [Corynebacterium sp. TAE3-ERU12]